MRTLTLIACFLCITIHSMAVNPPDHFPDNLEKSLYADEGSIFSQLALEELATLKKKEIKSKIGRKLTFREWLSLKVLKSKYRKMEGKIRKQEGVETKKLDILSVVSLPVTLIGFGLCWIPGGMSIAGLMIVMIGTILGLIALLTPERFRKKKGKGFMKLTLVIGLIALLLSGLVMERFLDSF